MPRPKKTALKAGEPFLELTGESKPPDWSRARELREGIKHALRVAIGAQVMLGHELLTLKLELGFLGSGRRPQHQLDENTRRAHGKTWEQWCDAELGISDMTANNMIKCYEAAKLRLKKQGGQKAMLALMDMKPAGMTEAQREKLAKMVDRLVEGETQAQLLYELKLAKAQHKIAGGDTSAHRKDNSKLTGEQMALNLFGVLDGLTYDFTKRAASFRTDQTYQISLHCLPLHGSDPTQTGLLEMRDRLRELITGEPAAMLKDVERVIAKRFPEYRD
ncbi:hypothetical protein [Haloferula sp. BvORR071]|uniref:hypothetical protein n=1 Tax=Haloferula sp. BvORR071 TaxID=1396141 RepID=UPI000554189A|nr:hypothetical protein [Haloferula sp. BvORR071]